MNKQSWFRRINILWFYPIVAVIIGVAVTLFAFLYNAGGMAVIVK
ncbi:MAG: hypothetical protein RRY79_06225 [Clostridia bacterium]